MECTMGGSRDKLYMGAEICIILISEIHFEKLYFQSVVRRYRWHRRVNENSFELVSQTGEQTRKPKTWWVEWNGFGEILCGCIVMQILGWIAILFLITSSHSERRKWGCIFSGSLQSCRFTQLLLFSHIISGYTEADRPRQHTWVYNPISKCLWQAGVRAVCRFPVSLLFNAPVFFLWCLPVWQRNWRQHLCWSLLLSPCLALQTVHLKHASSPQCMTLKIHGFSQIGHHRSGSKRIYGFEDRHLDRTHLSSCLSGTVVSSNHFSSSLHC